MGLSTVSDMGWWSKTENFTANMSDEPSKIGTVSWFTFTSTTKGDRISAKYIG